LETSVVKFILRVLISALGLWVASQLLHGVRADSVGSLVIAAVLLGLANAVVRPILIILTLPITLVTLGLFLLVINGLMVLLVGHLLHGFHVHGLMTAILTSVIVWITGCVGSMVLADEDGRSRR
jgi:putative membrane protein